MTTPRDHIRGVFGRRQSRLGDLSSSSDRVFRQATLPRNPTQGSGAFTAGIAAIVIGALIIGSFVLFRAMRPQNPLPVGSPTPNATSCERSSTYGVMVTGGKVVILGPSGCIVASATQARSSLRECASSLPVATPPAVSESNDTVYFRDGDNQIKALGVDGRVRDVTRVPGSSTTVSVFSVSPDNQRIAVMVETLSGSDSVSEHLYVEDLVGGGHHVDLFNATIAKGKGALAMWPVGWHTFDASSVVSGARVGQGSQASSGELVLALGLDCSVSPLTMPAEWRVVDARDLRLWSIVPGTNQGCRGVFWAAPAGVACAINDTTFVMDWTARDIARTQAPGRGVGPDWVVLSPSGRGVAFVYSQPIYGSPLTEALNWGETGSVIVRNELPCEWLDDGTMLAPDAVIHYLAGTATALPFKGDCAGRLPGGL